jgi:flagellar FliJ protein
VTREFPLAALLRLRRLREDDAAAALAGANADVAQAAGRAAATRDALAVAQVPDRGDELALRVALASRAALSGLLVEHDAAAQRASERARERAADWTGARRDTRALELLEERHDEEARTEELRGEQAVLDEVAGRRAASTRQEEDS